MLAELLLSVADWKDRGAVLILWIGVSASFPNLLEPAGENLRFAAENVLVIERRPTCCVVTIGHHQVTGSGNFW